MKPKVNKQTPKIIRQERIWYLERDCQETDDLEGRRPEKRIREKSPEPREVSWKARPSFLTGKSSSQDMVQKKAEEEVREKPQDVQDTESQATRIPVRDQIQKLNRRTKNSPISCNETGEDE